MDLQQQLEGIRQGNALAQQQMAHQRAQELETLKADLAVLTESVRSSNQRKFSIYPALVEVIYRLRNLARGCAEEDAPSSSVVDEFWRRLVELENTLYVNRFDLERGDVFFMVHAYKNHCRAFGMIARRLIDPSVASPQDLEQAREVYHTIDVDSVTLVRHLVAID